MTYTNSSMRQAQSKRTLALALVLFVCQIFVNCVWASVDYPDGEHPLGSGVIHTHSHQDGHSHSDTPSQPASLDVAISPMDANHEHEHTNHSHVTCHPPQDEPVEAVRLADEVVSQGVSSIQDRSYAPPIPPPNA